jgi:hypothetical protein
MDISDTISGRMYSPGQYPVVGNNADGDGRKRWAPIPAKERKEEARRLVRAALTGERRAAALFWVSRRRYTPRQLENFISRMESALRMKEDTHAES